MEPGGNTKNRSGLGRWLGGSGMRFRRNAEHSTPKTPADSQLTPLLETGYAIRDNTELTCLMEKTLQAVLTDTGASVGAILTPDEKETALVVRAALCVGQPTPIPAAYGFENSVEGQVFRSCHPYLSLPVRRQRGRTAPARPGLPGQPATSDPDRGETILCVPLLVHAQETEDTRALGTLTLRHRRTDRSFSDSECRLVRQAAGLIAGALVHAHSLVETKRSVLATLQNIVINLENKDAYTRNHSYRVTEVCGLLAAQLNLDANTVQILRTGAMLHDIGKIGVPSGILNKPGQLNAEEFALLKQYPIIGYNLCQPLGLGEEVLLLIRNHAEKLDGAGYPDQLRLGQIPVPLRILGLADAFDAMSSYRPYRELMDARERNEQLNRFAGTQFDPMIVETLKSLLNSGALEELYYDQWQLSAEMHSLYLSLAA